MTRAPFTPPSIYSKNLIEHLKVVGKALLDSSDTYHGSFWGSSLFVMRLLLRTVWYVYLKKNINFDLFPYKRCKTSIQENLAF